MALCRCLEKKHAWPEGRTAEYVAYVLPIGYPGTSSICGCRRCNKPAVIWLTEEEKNDYQKGKKIFHGPTYFVKVRADNGGLHGK
jgi:hypothetical protein